MSQNIDEGLTLLRSAADKKPSDFTIRQRLVEACVRAGRLDEAVREFAALVKAMPDFSQVHFETVMRVSRLTRVADLCSAFERATQAIPADGMAWYGLGLALQMTNDQAAAANAFKAGLKVAPHSGLLQYNLGVALMDNPIEAAVWLRGATRYSPNMAEPHHALGTLYMAYDLKRAAHHFREFIRLAPPHLHSYVESARTSLQMLGEER